MRRRVRGRRFAAVAVGAGAGEKGREGVVRVLKSGGVWAGQCPGGWRVLGLVRGGREGGVRGTRRVRRRRRRQRGSFWRGFGTWW